MSVCILDYSLNHLHNYNKIILESELERLTGNERAYTFCVTAAKSCLDPVRMY